MKRALYSIAALMLVLVLLNRYRAVVVKDTAADTAAEQEDTQAAPPLVMPSSVKDETREESAAPAAEAAKEAPSFIPTYFPKAKVVATVTDPQDSKGRQRVIETVETGMKEKYVRVEETFRRNEQGDFKKASAELAMVANQLLLQKPDTLDAETFTKLLKQAGALDVKVIGEAFLATFAARPEDPRALDAYMSKVKEVAGADVTVEPNYIRKLF